MNTGYDDWVQIEIKSDYQSSKHVANFLSRLKVQDCDGEKCMSPATESLNSCVKIMIQILQTMPMEQDGISKHTSLPLI